MVKMYNPALHEEPRSQRTVVIPQRQESSFLDWLQSTGRLVSRESGKYSADYDDEEEEELSEELTQMLGTTDTYPFEEQEYEARELELEE